MLGLVILVLKGLCISECSIRLMKVSVWHPDKFRSGHLWYIGRGMKPPEKQREWARQRKCGSNESLACKTTLRSPGVCSRHWGELAAVTGGKSFLSFRWQFRAPSTPAILSRLIDSDVEASYRCFENDWDVLSLTSGKCKFLIDVDHLGKTPQSV